MATDQGPSFITRTAKAETTKKHHSLPFEPDDSPLPSSTPDRAPGYDRLDDVVITMRDGTRLSGDVYLPANRTGPVPTVVTRMPYGKREDYCHMPVYGEFWARKGYAFLVQDVRGKFGSEGDFSPNMNGVEVSDGYDTADWAAAQPWCNGRIGFHGESYYGFTTFAAAVSLHPAIVCIAPGDISLDRYRCTFRYGALQINTVGNWAISMMAQQYQDMSEIDTWHMPLADMANAANCPSLYFDQIIDTPIRGPFWEARSLLEGYDNIQIPVLHWGGWYDNYVGWVLDDWRRMRDANGEANHNHLFIGPWDHEGSADYLGRAGRIDVGRDTLRHRMDTYQAFFDHYLMEIDNGFGENGPVQYFVMGDSAWRDSATWPPAEAVATTLYIHGDGSLNDAAPDDEDPDEFVYDPANPVADTLGYNCWALAGDMGDRADMASRDDVLVFITGVLADDMELTGPITAKLFAASTARDTDFTVTVTDIFPDGYGNYIQDGIIRASYRESDITPSNIEPGQVYGYDIDLWATSYVVPKGHRLRVEISSSCFNRYDRNPNTGDPFGRSATPIKATQTIHHSRQYPSHVTLSVMPR
jgi:uncharacterized protein